MRTVPENTVVPESTQVWAEIGFKDRFDRPFTPSSARYRVEDLDTDTELCAWTEITPAAVVDVAIDADVNRILQDCNPFETRVVSVQANHGLPNQITREFRYRVKNYRGFQ